MLHSMAKRSSNSPTLTKMHISHLSVREMAVLCSCLSFGQSATVAGRGGGDGGGGRGMRWVGRGGVCLSYMTSLSPLVGGFGLERRGECVDDR